MAASSASGQSAESLEPLIQKIEIIEQKLVVPVGLPLKKATIVFQHFQSMTVPAHCDRVLSA